MTSPTTKQLRTMPECPFSWSKKHSFEHLIWKIDGEPLRCKWCGFVDDLSDREQDKNQLNLDLLKTIESELKKKVYAYDEQEESGVIDWADVIKLLKDKSKEV